MIFGIRQCMKLSHNKVVRLSLAMSLWPKLCGRSRKRTFDITSTPLERSSLSPSSTRPRSFRLGFAVSRIYALHIWGFWFQSHTCCIPWVLQEFSNTEYTDPLIEGWRFLALDYRWVFRWSRGKDTIWIFTKQSSQKGEGLSNWVCFAALGPEP